MIELLLLVPLGCVLGGDAPAFEIVDLGNFGAGNAGTQAIADSGVACGHGTAPNGLNQHAFYWAGGSLVNIPPLTAPDGGDGWGFAVNDSGAVVGYCLAPGAFHPYMWTQEGGTIDLGVPPWSVGDYGQATAINSRGTVAGMVGSVPNNLRGCLWIDGEMLEIPTLGGSESQAHGINDRDDVVGMARLKSGKMRAFLVPAGDPASMITLQAPPEGGAWAKDINEDRTICGWGTNVDGAFVALRWTATGVIEYLPSSDAWDAFAYGMNDHGWIVGKVVEPDGTWHGVVWIDGELHLLDELAEDLPSGAAIRIARDVNNSGEIATTLVLDGAFNRAVLLRPVGTGHSADIDGDGDVDTTDLLIVLGEWGPCPPPGSGECPADLNGNGQVDTPDLLEVLSAWTGSG